MVTGTVIRKIKGGLLVDIGVNVFLPGSQVDIRRPGDIGDFIGRVIQAEVLKIDDTRRNIVISRRSLIERQREEDRKYLMQELEVGQIRKGIVKNIADFGAFVDLGGIDGLLHITDMAWERIGHPTEMVSIDQEIEVKVLHIDREKQKIALGLKQKDRNPWENIEDQVPGRFGPQRRSRQRDELRCVRQTGTGHRRSGPHQRDELDQTGQSPQRAGRHRCRNRSQDSRRRSRRATTLAGHEADPEESLGRGDQSLPRGQRRDWQRSAT